MVFKVVTGTLVSTNIQEFWTSDNGLNLQDVKPLNVGSPVKISYKSRYVKRWTSGVAEYFWQNSRRLEMWWNAVSSIWYIPSVKTKTNT